MAIANSLISKVAKIMTKFNVTDRLVYKRVQTRTGGDPLSGRGATVVNTDTLLSPQPVVNSKRAAALLGATSTMVPVGEYVCTVVSTALSRSELMGKNLAIVFKDSAGAEEELYIAAFDPLVVEGVDVAFDLVLSSKKR